MKWIWCCVAASLIALLIAVSLPRDTVSPQEEVALLQRQVATIDQATDRLTRKSFEHDEAIENLKRELAELKR